VRKRRRNLRARSVELRTLAFNLAAEGPELSCIESGGHPNFKAQLALKERRNDALFTVHRRENGFYSLVR